MADYAISRFFVTQSKISRIGPGSEVPIGTRGEAYKGYSSFGLLDGPGDFGIGYVGFRDTKLTRLGPGNSVPTGASGESYRSPTAFTAWEGRFDRTFSSRFGYGTPLISRIGPVQVPSGVQGESYYNGSLGGFDTGSYSLSRNTVFQFFRSGLGPGSEVPSEDTGVYSPTSPFNQSGVGHNEYEIWYERPRQVVGARVTTYLMGGWISGSPVVPWTSSDPTTANQYPGGPPYPSPFYVIFEY